MVGYCGFQVGEGHGRRKYNTEGGGGYEKAKWFVSCEFVALWSLLGGWMSNVTEAITEVVFECIRGRYAPYRITTSIEDAGGRVGSKFRRSTIQVEYNRLIYL